MHVQSSCFACLNLFLFCRSRCRRRLRCVNSLLLLWGGKLVVLLPEWCKGRSFVLRLWGGKIVVLLPVWRQDSSLVLRLWGGKLVVLLPEWCKGRSFVLRLWGGKLVVLLPEYKKLTLKLTSSIGASAIRNSRRMIEH